MKELPLQSVVNLRDFGATQTKDRKTVKIGLFLRSAALNRLSKKDADSSVRFTLGSGTTEAEIDYTIKTLENILKKLS